MNDPLDDYAGELPPPGHPILARITLFAFLLCAVLASWDYVWM